MKYKDPFRDIANYTWQLKITGTAELWPFSSLTSWSKVSSDGASSKVMGILLVSSLGSFLAAALKASPIVATDSI